MKKFIILVASALLLVSCTPAMNGESVSVILEPNRSVVVESYPFSYKGHEYFLMRSSSFTGMSIIHNPDCKCFKPVEKPVEDSYLDYEY